MTIPVVPLVAFCILAGPELEERVAELGREEAVTELVLFSDVTGGQLALVAVGVGRRFARLADAVEVELDGLRALCAWRVGTEVTTPVAPGRAKELEEWEKSLAARESYVAECEQRVAEVGQTLSEREAMLEQRELMLLEKERDFFRRGGASSRA